MTRFLVTGGCGFIGRNLLRQLLRDPAARIRVIDDLSVGARQDLAAIGDFTELSRGDLGGDWPRLALIVGDIRDAALAQETCAGAETVVHLAANTGVAPSVSDPRSDCVTNVIGTFNYLEACRLRQIRRFVFASSGAPVGECEPPIHEELPAHPVSPYGASKLAGEAYCSAYKRSFGIDTVALRFGNCYGPYSSHKSSVVAKFIREAFAGETWVIHGDGGQTRDFIFVDDIASAVINAATARDVGGEIFQIATNRETTVRELAESLAAVLAKAGIKVPPARNDAPRIGDVRRNFSDTRKARDRLGWVAQIPLAQGLERTVDWFLGTRPPR
ncbi:MAG TPA: NAD-dependent epimerase/dehydratase family protein [Stellaceae bacterium]|nr:NAD-dependent epimerase/dehydratase family protein [Stellaceae bacterium]